MRAPSTPHALLGLVAVGFAFFVQAYDIAGMGVALRSIGTDFRADLAISQWVMNALSLGYAIAILVGGRLADVLGPRRVLVAGMGLVAVGSLVGAAAPGIEWLIAGRAIEGVGAGVAWPAGLSFAYSVVAEDRAAAITGIVVAAIAAGNALGPMIGGLVVDTVGWRWVLIGEVPMALVVVLINVRFDAEASGQRPGWPIDYTGAPLLGAALVALLVGLDRMNDGGIAAAALCALAAALLCGFVVVERRAGAAAIVPKDVVAARDFRFACLAILTIAPAFWVALVYVPLLAQRDLRFSATLTGVAMPPMMFAFMATSLAGGPWYARHGPKRLMFAGAICACAGALLLGRIPDDPGYLQVAIGIGALGIGIGTFLPAVTTAAAMSVAAARRGVAMGVLYTVEIIGGAVGLAIATAIFTGSAAARSIPNAATSHGFRNVFLLVAVAAAASALTSIRGGGARPDQSPLTG